ncbi:hypothetical protein DERP_002067 [Dermatophagoides pteronyssinus]|uniref:Uncharacterized protein n=1 Tax=Dermatophagoides pteronyssinus TaxID=6956 RepID=A0ABQ8JGP7_DERPT|nr:hypothetical protein DERP_002067 [Dermatophagoides pteronyssinus]
MIPLFIHDGQPTTCFFLLVYNADITTTTTTEIIGFMKYNPAFFNFDNCVLYSKEIHVNTSSATSNQNNHMKY